ncbi:MAG: hypothetical protein JRI97_07705 [Deltaproteobacteria bacterium]|nr:hypothetical protein [Deltaproteobacteria bacterium]
MPVHPVRDKKGKIKGYQWGKKGKVYRGRGAKAKAEAQGRAAKAAQARRKGA